MRGNKLIKVAIVEDEKNAADLLADYFRRFSEKSGEEFLIFSYENPIVFLSAFRADFDLIMMDIELPDMDGMKTCEKIRETDKFVPIIFVTNMAQYAIRGYEVDASDFIVKPVSYSDFYLKLFRVVERIKLRSSSRIKITVGDGIKCVTLSDIRYVESDKHRIIYHTVSGNFESYGTLKKAEAELEGAGFAKCNKCYLVNLRYVDGVRGYSVFVGGDELQISYPKRAEFIKELNNFMGGGVKLK